MSDVTGEKGAFTYHIYTSFKVCRHIGVFRRFFSFNFTQADADK